MPYKNARRDLNKITSTNSTIVMEIEKLDQMNKAAFQKLGFEKAPDNFTASVMVEILNEKLELKTAGTPVIGNWGWFSIIFGSSLLILAVWFSSASQADAGKFLSFAFLNEWSNNYLQPLLSEIIKIGSQLRIVALIGVSATFLLLADRVMGNKFKDKFTLN